MTLLHLLHDLKEFEQLHDERIITISGRNSVVEKD